MDQRHRVEIEHFLMRAGFDAGSNAIAFTGLAGIVTGRSMLSFIAAVAAFRRLRRLVIKTVVRQAGLAYHTQPASQQERDDCETYLSLAKNHNGEVLFISVNLSKPTKIKVVFDNKSCYCVITMIRTQISLSESDYDAAKQEARRLGISLAELLRRSLRSTLSVDETKPWMRFAGMVETGDPQSSQGIDDVVYGQKD